jgi:hypothetical protein
VKVAFLLQIAPEQIQALGSQIQPLFRLHLRAFGVLDASAGL